MDRATCLQTLSAILSSKPDVVDQLKKIHQETTDIESFAANFDISPSIQANGFRTFVKIINSWFTAMMIFKDDEEKVSSLGSMSPVLIKQAAIMKLAEKKRDHNDRASFSTEDLKILKAILLDFSQEDMKPFFGPMELFYLDPVKRAIILKFAVMRGLLLLGPDQMKKLFGPESQEMRQQMSLKYFFEVSMDKNKKYGDLSFNMMQFMMQGMMTTPAGVEISDVSLPLKTPWTISHPGFVLQEQKYPVHISDTVKDETDHNLDAVYICSKDSGGKVKTVEDSLIIHYHGGGFVSMTPRQHSSYLSKWTDKIGVPVLCPNYRKAPENKFPCGLQDCLDTFMFVTSGREEVKQLLGFHPKRILLTGDSAGGNLAVAVTFALNDIRKKNNVAVKMPIGVYVLYPYSDPSMVMTPSEALSPISPFINPRPLENMIVAYPPTGVYMPRDDWFEREEEIEYWSRVFSPAWREPLINNLAYSQLVDMQNLADVPLFVNVCEFDPLLDQGLLLAKMWPNAVVDVVPDIHGWTFFANEATHSKELEYLYQRLRAGLKIQ